MANPRRTQAAPQRLILDSGALIALARNDDRARAVLAAGWESGVEPTIPSVVVAETVRGSAKDARVNRAIKSVGHVSGVTESTGRIAGALLAAARSTSTIDALVVATAVEAGGAVILTGDVSDLTALAVGHPDIVIQPL